MFKFSSFYENPLAVKSRIESIDILRGLVMALMALDHCRDFFHVYAFDYAPEDLRYSTPIVFYTRLISHFCAPVFVFFTGASAFLYKLKNNVSDKELAKYLLIRGAILILLEITIVRFAWRFYIDYSSIGGLVIWAIGWSMIALAGIIYLPRKIIGWLSLAIIFGHNLLDGINVEGNRFLELIWAFLHKSTFVDLTDDFGIRILYPVLPMIGLIGLGYYIGKWFTNEYKTEIRSGYLFYVGLAMIFLFCSIRVFQVVTEQYAYVFYINNDDLLEAHKWRRFFKDAFGYIFANYADPSPWTMQENLTYNVMAFFNTTKYPMSLLYILMTIGPSLIFLSLIENKNNLFTKIMKVFGKVPLFYYVLHLFLIHTLAILLAVLTHLGQIKEIIAGDWTALSKDYGFSIPVVYLIWLVVLAILYPACIAYGKLKSKGKYKILSYL
jgi:uncharacterized membrane protein